MPLNETQKTAILDVIIAFAENIKAPFEAVADGNEFVMSVGTLLSSTINKKVTERQFTEQLNAYSAYPLLHNSLKHMWDISHENTGSAGYQGLQLASSGVKPQKGEVRSFVFSVLFPLSQKIYNLRPSSIEDARERVNKLMSEIGSQDVSSFEARELQRSGKGRCIVL